jgi:Protein of unknown function (DUF1559)
MMNKLTCCCIGVILLGAPFMGAESASAQGGAKEKSLPEGLRHVPPDAMAFVHFRAAEFFKSDMGKTLVLRLAAEKSGSLFLDAIGKQLGVPLADVESMTLLFMGPPRFGMFGSKKVDKVPMAEPVPARTPFDKNERPEKDFKEVKPDFKDFDKKESDKKEKSDFEEAAAPVSCQPELILQDGPAVNKGYYGYGMYGGPNMQAMMELEMNSWEPLVIVTSAAPLNRKQLLKSFAGFEARHHGHFDGPGGFGRSILFLSDHSYLMGRPSDLARYTAHVAKMPPEPAPLAAALSMGIKKGRVLIAGAHVPSYVKKLMTIEGLRGIPEQLAPFAALVHTPAALALDLGKSTHLELLLQGPTERSAALAAQAAKSGLAVCELMLDRLSELLQPTKKDAKSAKTALLKQLDKANHPLPDFIVKANQALQGAKVDVQGTTVRVQVKMDLDPSTIVAVVMDGVNRVQASANRQQYNSNLRQIGVAMHIHAGEYRTLPPAAICDKNDKPLLSWRVAILPYIEQLPLYQQFRLDEAWDSDHNKKLIDRMPAIYAAPGIKTKSGMTHFQVFVGPGTSFEMRPGQGRSKGLRFAEITDGTANTLMVAEAAEPVIWTKPDDLPYDAQKPLPKLGGLYGNSFSVVFCDGSVRTLPADLPEVVLRALITRNGGEAVSPDF